MTHHVALLVAVERLDLYYCRRRLVDLTLVVIAVYYYPATHSLRDSVVTPRRVDTRCATLLQRCRLVDITVYLRCDVLHIDTYLVSYRLTLLP